MSTARGVWSCAGLGLALAALIGAVSMLADSTSIAQEVRRREPAETNQLRLRIASIDVASTRMGQSVPEEPARVWRHTFGAERRAEAVRQPLPISADIVVLRGVTSLAPVRQMFPARAYYVVVSRQILQQPDATAGRGTAIETTALAIRRDTGLRVMAQDHLLHLAGPPPGTDIRLAAGTAVRLMGHGRAIWALALDLAQGCPGEPAPAVAEDVRCQAAKQQLDAVDDWLSARMNAGETVMIAGRFHRELGPDGLPGNLARLSRFPSRVMPTAQCTGNAGSLAATYVLAGSGSGPESHVTLDGRFELVDKSAPENGCLLMVEASL